MGRGSFASEFWMSHCNHSCAKVCEPIKLSFREESDVGPGIGVLDGGPHSARGRVVTGVF